MMRDLKFHIRVSGDNEEVEINAESELWTMLGKWATLHRSDKCRVELVK